ncbi:MAG: carbohydrate ABC transporter permease [Anaerolineae bacterium]
MKGWQHGLVSVGIVIVVAIWSLLPFYWLVVTSFKPVGTEFRLPIAYLPDTVTLDNYATVTEAPFTIQNSIMNSLFVSTTVTIITVFLASLSAYAIARLRFRYKVQSLILLQIGGMVPPVVVIYPTFILMREFGLLGTVYSLILPNIAYNIPLSTWLLTAYFSGLPYELEDAAMTDGFSPFSIYWRVMLPLATPALFSAGIIAFLGSWGEFILALTLLLGKREAQTVPAAIMSLSQQFELQWAWVAAAIVLSLLPIIAITLVFQRWVVRGLTTGTVKY